MSSKALKITIFTILMLVIALLFWHQLATFFSYRNVLLDDLIYLGISFFIFLVFLLLFSVLVENRIIVYSTLLVLSGSFLFFFPLNYIYLIAIIIFFILIGLSYEFIQLEHEDRLRVSLKRIWGRGKTWIIIAMALIIAVAYYFNPLLKVTQDKIEIPPQLISFLMKPLGGMMGKMLPFYSPEMTIDELLASSVMVSEGGQINPETISPELLNKLNLQDMQGMDINALLKNPEISQLLQQEVSKQTKNIDPRLLAQQRNEFAQSLDIQLTGQEKMDEVISKLANAKLGDFIGPYSQEISVGLAVVLFLLLRYVITILMIVVMIVAQIFFLILRATNVVAIEKIMKEGEIIRV